MWGSNAIVSWDTSGQPSPEVQVADVRLPEACITSCYFQAQLTGDPTVVGSISVLTLTLNVGLGRVTMIRRYDFIGLPYVGNPIQFTIPFLPAAQILASVQGVGASSTPGKTYDVLCDFQAAPIARFPHTNDPLKFGMALPGEADGLDDEMLTDLEEHAPDEAQVMREAQERGEDPTQAVHRAIVEGDEETDDAGDDAGDEPRIIIPARFDPMIAKLERQLGRPVRVKDLPPYAQRVVRKLAARQLRKGRR